MSSREFASVAVHLLSFYIAASCLPQAIYLLGSWKPDSENNELLVMGSLNIIVPVAIWFLAPLLAHRVASPSGPAPNMPINAHYVLRLASLIVGVLILSRAIPFFATPLVLAAAKYRGYHIEMNPELAQGCATAALGVLLIVRARAVGDWLVKFVEDEASPAPDTDGLDNT